MNDIISNSLGGYYLQNIKSRYSGLFFFINNSIYKIIDEFRSKKKPKISMVDGKNSCIINSRSDVELIFDIKESYDNSEFGRNYEIIEKKDEIMIRFSKDNKFTLYVSIVGFKEYKKTSSWLKKDYGFDKERNSPPFERWVYSAIKLKGKDIVLSVSDKESDAIKGSAYIRSNIKKNKLNRLSDFSISSYLVKTEDKWGLFAGLPWFFQMWSRDELVSLKALMLAGKKKEAKDILLRNLGLIAKDGRLPNQTSPLSNKTNADSIGWLFKRIEDYGNFDQKEKKLIKTKLEFSIKNILKNYMKDCLIYNEGLETWMDTEWGFDNRAGFRIEIQSLFLNMLKLAYKMTKKKKYKILEGRIKQKVRSKFFNGTYLIDGLEDWTKRPNVFIAAYVYPELLTKQEWKICFNSILSDIWLRWGGLATIDKHNPLFCQKHTGEIPQSYHRGDSWFWINNLAAIVLYRTDKKLFKNYINKIIKASKNMHSELSSASKLSEEGCLFQAWTDAMYLEMKKEIKNL